MSDSASEAPTLFEAANRWEPLSYYDLKPLPKMASLARRMPFRTSRTCYVCTKLVSLFRIRVGCRTRMNSRRSSPPSR